MKLYFLLGLLLLNYFVTSHDVHKANQRHPRSVNGQKKMKHKIDDENDQFWKSEGQDALNKALKMVPNTNIAKNIILFIGDGMSLPTVAAARIYKNQQKHQNENLDDLADFDGNSEKLSWEEFPNVGLSMTYNSDYMVSDSASTAFAMYSGVKTTGYTMGYDNTIEYMNMGSVAEATEVETILDWAQAKGMKTGFVTTTRMSHATPAALYSKTASRFWECEEDIWDDINDGKINETDYKTFKPKDITRQLVEKEQGKKIDIMLGGGRASWLPKTNETEPDMRWDYDTYDWNCNRRDGRNLIEEWEGNNTDGVYVGNRSSLMNLSMNETKVLGIFSESYIYWDHEVNDTANDMPRLEDMATQAVKFLQTKAEADDTGYFIMIEAGRIDQAHHNGQATTALSETVAFDKAIEAVMKLLNRTDDTLVLVTADHSHTMTIGGYTSRFHDITGVVDDPNFPELSDNTLADDGDTITILSYGNGPGFKDFETRSGPGNWTEINRKPMKIGSKADYSHHQPSGQPIGSETHGGDDVGIWAIGPMSHLIHGVHQQSYIAHVMSYAACIGPYDNDDCRANRKIEPFSGTPGQKFSYGLLLIVISILKMLSH